MISIGNKCTWKGMHMHKSDKNIYSKSKPPLHPWSPASQVLPQKQPLMPYLQSTPFSPYRPKPCPTTLFCFPESCFLKHKLILFFFVLGYVKCKLLGPSYKPFPIRPHRLLQPSPHLQPHSQALFQPGPSTCSGLNPCSHLAQCIFKNNF